VQGSGEWRLLLERASGSASGTQSTEQQSTRGTDDDTVANFLWKFTCDTIVPAMFPGYMLVCAANHTHDLFPQLMFFQHCLANRRTAADLAALMRGPQHPKRRVQRAAMLTMPRSYYNGAFNIQSYAMLAGVSTPLSTIETDASFRI
jgi:hypothetical protein